MFLVILFNRFLSRNNYEIINIIYSCTLKTIALIMNKKKVQQHKNKSQIPQLNTKLITEIGIL